MPYFVFFASDRPGMDEVRARVREEHRVRLRQAQPGCRCVLGGPMVADAGARMDGTLLVFEADDRAAVERFMAGDPYVRNDLFERVEIRRWSWGLGKPE
jgi:hypothetical protein